MFETRLIKSNKGHGNGWVLRVQCVSFLDMHNIDRSSLHFFPFNQVVGALTCLLVSLNVLLSVPDDSLDETIKGMHAHDDSRLGKSC